MSDDNDNVLPLRGIATVDYANVVKDGIAYLNDRGVSEETAQTCGIEVHGRGECLNALGREGKVASHPWEGGIIIPLGTGKARQVVWLRQVPSFIEDPLKKTTTAKEVAPVALFSPPIHWSKSDTLYLCESPVKAMALWQRGYNAVAGCGVDGIYTKNNGFTDGWPDKEVQNLARVCIVYDADYGKKGGPARAIAVLAAGINQQYPHITTEHYKLPPVEGDAKAGIDDAIMAWGDDWLHEWLADAGEVAEPDQLMTELARLNKEFTVCKSPPGVFDLHTGVRYKLGEFKEIMSNRCFKDQTAKRAREVFPAVEWIKHKDRNTVDELVFKPGAERLRLPDFFNTWQDDSVPGIKSDDPRAVWPFLRVYRNAIPERSERKAVYDCMAYIVQHPDKKLPKALFFVDRRSGSGKSLLAHTIEAMVGENNCFGQNAIAFSSQFTGQYAKARIVTLDDAIKLDKQKFARLKELVTATRVSIERKGVDPVMRDFYATFIITSNERDALPIDGGDRRIQSVAFDPKVFHKSGTAYWDNYVAWLEGNGMGYIKQWLLDRDIGDFNPNYLPEMTLEREELAAAGRSEEQIFADLVRTDPDEALGTPRSVMTTNELWTLMGNTGTVEHGGRWGDLVLNGVCQFTKANGGRKVNIKKGLVSKVLTDAGSSERTKVPMWVVRDKARRWKARECIADVEAYRMDGTFGPSEDKY